LSTFRWPARIGLTLLATVSAGGLAAPAFAATTAGVVTVVKSTQVQYKAAAGKANAVVVTRSGRTVTIDDKVAVKAGKGCKAVKGDKTKVRCTTAKNPTRVNVYLGDKNDSLVNNTALPMSVYGGSGGDRITGGPSGDYLDGGPGGDSIYGLGGNDTIHGDDGNDALNGGDGNDYVWGDNGNDGLSGGNGNDELFGGMGNDRLFGGNGNDGLDDFAGNDYSNGGPGDDFLYQQYQPGRSDADTLLGGSGDDYVTYAGRTASITADADGVKGDDGQAGEHDSIGTDVETIQGGEAGDRLIGTPRADRLVGGGGNDTLTGGAGDDVLVGDEGNDHLDGGAGTDSLYGDAGNDELVATDGAADLVVDGGANASSAGDLCLADPADPTTNCERFHS
jgi:Ca2+-binding RTX toxin-like protein